MNQNDINRLFTQKVTELITQGYQINPATMNGHQGEIGKVDLRKGSEIIRVLLDSGSGYGEKPDFISLMIGRATDDIDLTRMESIGNTIWNQHLEILSEIKFAKIAPNFFTDMETGKQMLEKRHSRWRLQRCKRERNLSDAFKPAALRYVQRQPRMKNCKLSDITRVTRINRSTIGEALPDLYGYEIEARGKTFLLRAPRADR